MFVRNYKGKIVKFNWRDYNSEKEMYESLWKISYNIVLTDNTDFNKTMIDFIM